MGGIDYVIHAAANREGDWETFEESTIRGTEKVFAAARKAKVKRIVYISSMSVYQMAGLKSGAVIVEDSMYEKDPAGTWILHSLKAGGREGSTPVDKEGGCCSHRGVEARHNLWPAGSRIHPLIGISLFERSLRHPG